MKIIDARSGQEMKVGDVARYHGGETLQLLDAEVGWWSARLLVRTNWHEQPGGYQEHWVDAPVRYTHPSFFLEKVVFIPS